jgi:hypothetical protein
MAIEPPDRISCLTDWKLAGLAYNVMQGWKNRKNQGLRA